MAWVGALAFLVVLWGVGYLLGGLLLSWLGVDQLVRIAFALSFGGAIAREIANLMKGREQ